MRPDTYDEMRALEDRHWWFRGRRSVLRPLVRRALGSGGGAVLDLGCGTGGNLAAFAPEFGARAAIGVDASERALGACSARGLQRVVRADGARLPLAAGAVACALAFDVLEHVEDDRAWLAELHRVLCGGGQLIVSVPAYPSLWSTHDEALGHVRRYRRGELEAKLHDAGFEVEARHGFNFLLLPLIAAARAVRRRASGGPPTTDFFALPRPLDAALAALFTLERALLALAPVPFGVSFVALARKRAAQ